MPRLLSHSSLLCFAACLLVTFCSCRALPTSQTAEAPVVNAPAKIARPQPPVVTGVYYPTGLPHANQPPQHAANGDCGCGCKHHGRGTGEAFRFNDSYPTQDSHTQWAPDGISLPWPQDEYIWDGGDRNRDVTVTKKGTVHGLDLEDTVVHYDTYTGKTEVAASNRVPLYAPRFASVRNIVSLEENEKADRLALTDKPLPVGEKTRLAVVTNVNQPLQPVNQLGINQSQIFRERNAGLTADSTRHIAQAHSEFLPYEQFRIIRQGLMDAGEKPRLSQAIQSAIVWTDNKAVQVVIDGKLPYEAVNNQKVGETILYDRKGKPQMRIVKIADKSEAKPGEIVRFTLRFDNVGDEQVDRVTIIDNLTTRLEYVEKSQECSHPHNFVTTDNEAVTLVLRWELDSPIRAGEGGLIRFQCRVR